MINIYLYIHTCPPFIFHIAFNRRFPFCVLTQLRANWFQLMTLLQDESVQIRGVTFVVYDVDNTYQQIEKLSLKDRVAAIPMYTEAIPVRVASCHYCFNEPSFRSK